MTRPRDAKLEDDIVRYLATGDSDPLGQARPAKNTLEGMIRYGQTLRDALAAEVRRRSRRRRHPKVPDKTGSASFARCKLEPMVRGLFPKKEQDVVLGVVEQSIIFLTRDATLRLIKEVGFHHSAWQIANVYLDSIGAATLGDEPFSALGMNEETRCYVSLTYFEEENPFADYVVHEAAHIFHNTKRQRVGLHHTRHREWMLEIEFHKRENFAYTCEVYSRILEQGRTPSRRRALFEEYRQDPIVADDRVDTEEHLDILAEAVAARNGWRRILRRCAPPKRGRASNRDAARATNRSR